MLSLLLLTGSVVFTEKVAPPARVWLAGLDSANDVLYQDVAIPAGTTGLSLRGMYDIRSGELGLGGPYDLAWLELTTTTGTVLETVLAVSERNETTAWTAFSKTFTGAYAGQTVRLRFRATTDASDLTAFYFDSLALDATSCP